MVEHKKKARLAPRLQSNLFAHFLQEDLRSVAVAGRLEEDLDRVAGAGAVLLQIDLVARLFFSRLVDREGLGLGRSLFPS